MTRKSRCIPLAFLAFAALWPAGPANAGSMGDYPALMVRAYSQADRIELSAPMYYLLINEKYTRTNAFGLQLVYHVGESFSVGLDGAYALSDETKLAMDLRAEADKCKNFIANPLEVERRLLVFTAGANFLWSPLYGKFNLVSELALSFDLFLSVGGGIAGFDAYTADSRTVLNEETGTSTWEGGYKAKQGIAVKPSFNLGGGLHVFILKWFGLRFEFRDVACIDSGEVAGGRTESMTRHMMFFLLGTSWLF
jgi:outer membrane beta-barrel protein